MKAKSLVITCGLICSILFIVAGVIYLLTPLKSAQPYYVPDIHKSIVTALEYIISRQAKDGSFSDFPDIEVGASNIWVTAYTAHILDKFSEVDSKAKTAYLKARDFLLKNNKESGWGYNQKTAADGDSTSITLLALHKSDKKLLRKYRNPDGGYCTYDSPKKKAWHLSDPSITGRVLEILADNGSMHYLKKKQHPDGYWLSYWWHDLHYPTATAVTGLLNHAYTPDKTESWLKKNQHVDGGWNSGYSSYPNPFSTALAIRTLLSLNSAPSPNITNGISWLIRNQNKDGSWIKSAPLRVPLPTNYNPWILMNPNRIYYDKNRIFTTATVLETLYLFKKSQEKKEN